MWPSPKSMRDVAIPWERSERASAARSAHYMGCSRGRCDLPHTGGGLRRSDERAVGNERLFLRQIGRGMVRRSAERAGGLAVWLRGGRGIDGSHVKQVLTDWSNWMKINLIQITADFSSFQSAAHKAYSFLHILSAWRDPGHCLGR
jgi:hypothetical protein